jgi:hypothetical protein
MMAFLSITLQKKSGTSNEILKQLQDIERNSFDNPKYGELLLNITTPNMF